MRVRSRFVSRLLLFVMFTLMAAVVIPVASAPQASAEVTNCATVTTISSAECLALVALYDSTNGAGWTTSTNWKQDDPCAWQGVTCAGAQVTILWLNNNNLVGAIPTEIGNLTNLTTLNLGSNALSGPIPSSIGLLTNLANLYLGSNALSGPIPSSIDGLTNLTYLALADNALSGPIPSQIGLLTGLTYLGLANNNLSGPIPSEIGLLTNLTNLNLFNNDLSGAIPTEIGNLTGLTYLGLHRNALSGTIPSQIGLLTGLTGLFLGNNQLSGPIPSQIGLLTNLTNLFLSDNVLSGEIPSSIGLLTNLTALRLNPNGCLWASNFLVTAFVTSAIDTAGTNGAALNDACKPPPVVCGALCEGVTVLEGPNECGVVKVQVPSGLMGLLDLSVPVSVDTNRVVFDALLPSDGIISFTYPDGFGPVFTFGATLINGGYGGNYTSTVTILAPTTAPAAGCEPATETETADTETETAETETADTAVAAAVAAPVLAFTGTGSGLTQLALAITGAGALMMTVSRRRR